LPRDDLDGDKIGPSWCDPTDEDERGVFRAIRKVFASFYFDNAFLERLRRGVDPADVGMAMLVHHSFPTNSSWPTASPRLSDSAPHGGGSSCLAIRAVSVTNPEGGAIPEEVHVYLYGTYMWAKCALLEPRATRRHGDGLRDDYLALAVLMRTVADDYAAAIGETRFLLDYEYKKLAPGGAAMPRAVWMWIRCGGSRARHDAEHHSLPDQRARGVRHLPGRIRRRVRQSPLKSQWRLSTQSLWMDEEHLADSFYTDAWLEYTKAAGRASTRDCCRSFPSSGTSMMAN